jgi:hypothetical protein
MVQSLTMPLLHACALGVGGPVVGLNGDHTYPLESSLSFLLIETSLYKFAVANGSKVLAAEPSS